MQVQIVGGSHDANRLPHEWFGFVVPAAPGERLRSHQPPANLRDDVALDVIRSLNSESFSASS